MARGDRSAGAGADAARGASDAWGGVGAGSTIMMQVAAAAEAARRMKKDKKDRRGDERREKKDKKSKDSSKEKVGGRCTQCVRCAYPNVGPRASLCRFAERGRSGCDRRRSGSTARTSTRRRSRRGSRRAANTRAKRGGRSERRPGRQARRPTLTVLDSFHPNVSRLRYRIQLLGPQHRRYTAPSALAFADTKQINKRDFERLLLSA